MHVCIRRRWGRRNRLKKTVRDFNLIIPTRDGRIAERGAHCELMKLNGAYAFSDYN